MRLSEIVFETLEIENELNAEFFILNLMIDKIEQFIDKNVGFEGLVVSSLTEKLKDVAGFAYCL